MSSMETPAKYVKSSLCQEVPRWFLWIMKSRMMMTALSTLRLPWLIQHIEATENEDQVVREQYLVEADEKDVTDTLTTPDYLARDNKYHKGSSVGDSEVKCDGVPDVPIDAQYSFIDGDCSVEVKSWGEDDLYLSARHWGELSKSTTTSITVSYWRKCKEMYVCKFCLCRICNISDKFCPTCSHNVLIYNVYGIGSILLPFGGRMLDGGGCL